MRVKKVLKILAWIVGVFVLVIISFIGIAYIKMHDQFDKDLTKYPNYIGYINPEKALHNKKYVLCDEGQIYATHHGLPKKAFHISKNHFRTTILSEYNNDGFDDSGYLNFRFLVNCEGKAGWFEISEMNLDLEETDLNDQMVNQLLELTSNEKHWATFYVQDVPKNYYMYISYRIENGKIVEILP